MKLFEHHGKAAVYFIVVLLPLNAAYGKWVFFVVVVFFVVFCFLHFTIMIAFFIGFFFKLMDSGVLGAVGQSALRLVEVATKSENEPALIQPLRTVVVDAKDQTISRRAVTVNCAQVRKDTSYSRFSNT